MDLLVPVAEPAETHDGPDGLRRLRQPRSELDAWQEGRRGEAHRAKGLGLPEHLAGRAYGVVVHGGVAGVESHRRNLADWLEWMGLTAAGAAAKLDRYIGFYEPYYNCHDTLDKDKDVQEEVRNVARSVVSAVC